MAPGHDFELDISEFPSTASDKYKTYVKESPGNHDIAKNIYNRYLIAYHNKYDFNKWIKLFLEDASRNKQCPSIDTVDWNPESLRHLSEAFGEYYRKQCCDANFYTLPDDECSILYAQIARNDITSMAQLVATCRQFKDTVHRLFRYSTTNEENKKVSVSSLSTYKANYTAYHTSQTGISICDERHPYNVRQQLPTMVTMDINSKIIFKFGEDIILLPFDSKTRYNTPIIKAMQIYDGIVTSQTTHFVMPFWNNVNNPLYHFRAKLVFVPNRLRNEATITITLNKLNGFNTDRNLLRLKKRRYYDDSGPSDDNSHDDSLDTMQELRRVMEINNKVYNKKFQHMRVTCSFPLKLVQQHVAPDVMDSHLHFSLNTDVRQSVNYHPDLCILVELIPPLSYISWIENVGRAHPDPEYFTRLELSSHRVHMDNLPPAGGLQDHPLIQLQPSAAFIVYLPGHGFQYDGNMYTKSMPNGNLMCVASMRTPYAKYLEDVTSYLFFNNRRIPSGAILGHTWRFSKSRPDNSIIVDGFNTIQKLLFTEEISENKTVTINKSVLMGTSMAQFPTRGCFERYGWFCYPTDFLPFLNDKLVEARRSRAGKW